MNRCPRCNGSLLRDWDGVRYVMCDRSVGIVVVETVTVKEKVEANGIRAS